MATKKQTKGTLETSIYIGASLPGLPQYTVFKNGVIPAAVTAKVQANKHLAGLIVPISSLQESRKNMRMKGHVLNFHATHLMDKE